MYRRFLVALFRRSIVVLVLICLGCSAQSVSPDVSQRIERQIRSYYNIPPSVKIMLSPTGPSDIAGYDSLKVTFEGAEKKQQYDFLLSKDSKTLLRVNRFDLTKDPYADVMSKIKTSGRPVRGNPSAKVVAVNFDDFQCPFCSNMHETLFPELLKEYGDRVAFIYKDYPLVEIHPWATHAAVNANCLMAQNEDAYWTFADYVHAHRQEVNQEKGLENQFAALDRIAMQQGNAHKLDAGKLQSCIKAQNTDGVRASMKEGEDLGVQATPTLFINGEKVDGALPASELRQILDRALQQAGVPAPAHPAASAGQAAAPGK